MNRRRFVKQASLATTGILLSRYTNVWGSEQTFPTVRVAAGERNFTSQAVERVIADVKRNIGNKELAWMFENCFPNTLDTTVDFEMIDGKPDTYVITGDIDAMWLRDSSAQVWPYLPLCKEDEGLKQMIKGVINRQTKCILKDPYANAFYKNEHKKSPWHTDQTIMQRGIHERKWEIDSLCYPIRLAHGYWKETGDTSPFDAQWAAAMALVIKTFKEQQRLEGKGPYSFMRKTEFATDSVPMGGYGYPVRPNGLICSMFRPSDDATVYPYLVASNYFAFASLEHMLTLATAAKRTIDTDAVNDLMKQIATGLANDTKVKNGKFGEIFAYEVNGYGGVNLMDDANVPSLLSLSYLVPAMKDDSTYKNTRKFVLSPENPFFFKGKAGEGIGGPHVGMDQLWPISIAMRGLTSNDDTEIKLCLDMLQRSHAGTGFMHEAFDKDDATKYTRPWFAWANTLFGEFIWKVYRERQHLLNT
ncbi:MAG: metal-independent alpha-mannosidase [Flavipsychrobacter sp.]|nr:metal-independent alpha-mannosidase [Flavipsychrobacter sp.]